jgi:hypothetical protein
VNCAREKGKFLMKLNIVVPVFALLLVVVNVHGQELSETHHYKTADKSFWLLTAAAYGTDVAEVEITQSCLHSGRCTGELNPLLGTHRAQAYAVSMAATTLTTYLSYRWKRRSERTIAAGSGPRPGAWWIPQLAIIGGHGVGIGVTFALRGPKK